MADGCACACELLEGFVGVGVCLAAQYCLYGFGHHGPVALEVGTQGVLVEQQFAEAFERALHGNGDVAEWHANVAQHCGVGEVALQAAHGQLLCQVGEQCVGHAEVALGVLEVDGVDLMRHCAAAYLSGFHALAEIAHGDILPYVAVEVDDDGGYAAQCVE